MKTRIFETARERGDWQGMNWITQKKRLAIYLRDGMACVWCASSVEEGVKLTLDHLLPHSKGGSNHEDNLVTCCKRCNDSRGRRGQLAFARAVATYINHGITAAKIMEHVRACSRRSLSAFLIQAATLIEARGSVAKVLAQFQPKGE